MIEIFMRIVPFFALVALGYAAGKTRFFPPEATAYLTKFVFFFPLSALIFRFSSSLTLEEIWNTNLVLGYLLATSALYLLAFAVGRLRGEDAATTAVEAQCATIGNVGFLGIPMLTLLLGAEAIGPIVMAVSIDLVIFSSVIVIVITGAREGRVNGKTIRTVCLGLVQNPMIVAIVAGLAWSFSGWPLPASFETFLDILAPAATPGALFAIGASLAAKSAERIEIAAWLSFCKLVLHPVFVAIALVIVFPVDPFTAAVVISTAALPVASNVYMLAQHYQVAAQRASTAILFSTVLSMATLSMSIAFVSP